METSPGVFVQALSNIGKVRSQGVELEVQAVPVEGLRWSLTSSYNDAVYRSYANAPCSAEKLAAGLTVCDLTGGQVVGAPKWIASTGVQYEHAVDQRPGWFCGRRLLVALELLRLGGQLRAGQGESVRHPEPARGCRG